MPDSIAIWDPGFVITDSADNPISGATAEFFDAGTTNAKTVYSDSGLSTSLGTIVYADSAGRPVSASGSTTRVAVYVGVGSYKVIIKDSSGTIIETKDNLKGAIDTSTFDDASVALPSMPFLLKSADYTVTTADRGKIIDVDCTSGDITITLANAVTAGDGWIGGVRHEGSANKVILQTVSSQTMSLPLAGGAAQSFELVSNGESILYGSNGANYRAISVTQGLKLGSGYHSTVYDNGTKTGGTLTVDPEESNLQKVINGGAFTLDAPTEDTMLTLQITNNASAGAVDTTAFTKVTGDSLNTTDTHKFKCYINVLDGVSHLSVVGMQ